MHVIFLIISLLIAFSCPPLLLLSLPGLSLTSRSVFLKSWFCIYEIFVSLSFTSHDTLLLSQQPHLLSNGCYIFIFSAVGFLTPFTLAYPGPRLLVLTHNISTYFIFFTPLSPLRVPEYLPSYSECQHSHFCRHLLWVTIPEITLPHLSCSVIDCSDVNQVGCPLGSNCFRLFLSSSKYKH